MRVVHGTNTLRTPEPHGKGRSGVESLLLKRCPGVLSMPGRGLREEHETAMLSQGAHRSIENVAMTMYVWSIRDAGEERLTKVYSKRA
jgi:hypothetical protein